MNRRSFLLALSPLAFAPAPLPRRVRGPADQVTPGRYVLSWPGGPWEANLEPDGFWSARRGDLLFVGSWGWDGGTRTLVIRERLSGPGGGGRQTYELRLDRGLSAPGGEIRLERK